MVTMVGSNHARLISCAQDSGCASDLAEEMLCVTLLFSLFAPSWAWVANQPPTTPVSVVRRASHVSMAKKSSKEEERRNSKLVVGALFGS